MSRPIPNVTLGGFRPNQVKINSIGIGIDDDNLNSLNLDATQYMVVGEQTSNHYSLIVDSEGVAINSEIIDRYDNSNEYALYVGGSIYVTGQVVTQSGGTLSNVAGGGSGSACNFWLPVRTGNVSDSTNIFYDGKINIATQSHSRGNAYRVNISDNANRNITHAQLAIQNEQGAIARMGILGYSNWSPVILNSSKGAIEFHANRDMSYFNGIYQTTNPSGGKLPFYASNSVAPHMAINPDGTVGIKASPNPPLTYTVRTTGGASSSQVIPTTVTNKPADLHVNGTTFSCNMLIFDYESKQAQSLDSLYVRKLGVTFAASQVVPGNFAEGDYTFLNNLSIGGPIEPGCNLSVYGKAHVYDQFYADKAVFSSNLVIKNLLTVSGTADFEHGAIVNDDLQVNENLIIWGGFYADSNALYTFVPGETSNEIANISFIQYIANGWSNLYMQGAGFITPGMVGIGVNPYLASNDQVPSQLTVISRDETIYAMSLFEKTDESITKALFVGHQRSNIIRGIPDASTIFSTPAKDSPYFSTTGANIPQNIYFYPGQYDKEIFGQGTVIDSNPPILGVFESHQVAINSFKPDPATQLYVKGSIGYSSNIYRYNESDNTLSRIAEFRYGPMVGINNGVGISYNDPSTPHVGINRAPSKDYGLALQGGLLADEYYTANDEKGYLWLDSATDTGDNDPTAADGMYVLSKVGIGNNTPDYLLDLYGDNQEINNNYGTYIRLKKATIEGMSNTGIRFDGPTDPWFANMETVSEDISRFVLASSPDIYNLVNSYVVLPVYWSSNYRSDILPQSSIYNSNITYSVPAIRVDNLTPNSSNIVNTSNITNIYRITYVSNITSNLTSNINQLLNVPSLRLSITYDYRDPTIVIDPITNITTTSNYNSPSAPTLSNVSYTSNIIYTSNITNTSNIYYGVNTSNYLYSSNNTGILIQHDRSRGAYGHQVVVGGNSFLIDNTMYNTNPNPYATLTVNGDTSIIGNLNVTGRITATNTVTPTSSGRSNVPSIEQDDLFISSKDLFINPTNKMYVNYTCNLLDNSLERTNLSILNVYQDLNNSLVAQPVPVAHFISRGNQAFIEIVSEDLRSGNGDGVLRIGLFGGNSTYQTMGIRDGANKEYMSFRREGTQRFMGINIEKPDAQFHILNNGDTLNKNMLRITFDNGSGSDTANYSANIMLEKKYSENTDRINKQWIIEGPIYGAKEMLSFTYKKIVTDVFDNQDISTSTVLSITSNGCIGVNTTNPEYLVDIVTSNVGDNHGLRLWNKVNTDIAQLIFQSGENPDIGGDIYADYVMYSCNSEFIFKQRRSDRFPNTLFYFNSNANLGINTTPNDSYNLSLEGKLNVSDSIYIGDRQIASINDYTSNGYIISGSNNIFLKPNAAQNGGVVINGISPTGNLFHIFNTGTSRSNMAVFDSVLPDVELALRNKELYNKFNTYKMYASSNNFGLSYQQSDTYATSIPEGGWKNVLNIRGVPETDYSEHDVVLNGTVSLYSSARGMPSVSFGTSGEIGGNDDAGALYIMGATGGNVGIGTTMPTAPFHVHAQAVIGQGLGGSHNDTMGGPFFKQQPWDVAGTTHTIPYPSFCVGDNSAGMLYVQVTNKSTSYGNEKIGNLQASFIKAYNNSLNVSEISNHKNDTLTTLSITTNSTDIIITTDSDCSISWTSIGSY